MEVSTKKVCFECGQSGRFGRLDGTDFLIHCVDKSVDFIVGHAAGKILTGAACGTIEQRRSAGVCLVYEVVHATFAGVLECLVGTVEQLHFGSVATFYVWMQSFGQMHVRTAQRSVVHASRHVEHAVKIYKPIIIYSHIGTSIAKCNLSVLC